MNGETQRTIAGLWNEVLHTEASPGAEDNFFALGGDSMSVVMVEFRIKEELGIELPAGTIFGVPVLQDLAALVEQKRTSDEV